MNCPGDPVSVTLSRQREWDETIRLHFYNQENELLLHGNLHTTSGYVCGILHSLLRVHVHVHVYTSIDPGFPLLGTEKLKEREAWGRGYNSTSSFACFGRSCHVSEILYR